MFEELRRQGLVPFLDRDLATGQPPRHGHRADTGRGDCGQTGVEAVDGPSLPRREGLGSGTDVLGQPATLDDLAPQRPAGPQEHLGPLGGVAGHVTDDLHEPVGVVRLGRGGDRDLRRFGALRLLRPGPHDQRRDIRTPRLGRCAPRRRPVPAELLPARHRDLRRLPRPLCIGVAFRQECAHRGRIVEATGVVEEVGEEGAGPVEIVGGDSVATHQRPLQRLKSPPPLDARRLEGRRSLVGLSGSRRPLRLGLFLLHRGQGPGRDIECRGKRGRRIVVVVGGSPAELLEKGPGLAGEVFVVTGDVRGELLGITQHPRLLPLLVGGEDLGLLRQQLRRADLHPQPIGVEPVGRHVRQGEPLEPVVELLVDLFLQPALERGVDRLGTERRHETRFPLEAADGRERQQRRVEKLAALLRHRLGLGKNEVVPSLVVPGIKARPPLGIFFEQLPVPLGRSPHDHLPFGRPRRKRPRLFEVRVADEQSGLEQLPPQFVLTILEPLHRLDVGR